MSFNFTLTRTDTGLARLHTGAYVRADADEPIGVNDTDGTHIGLRFPKALTNLFRNSEPAVDPSQGTRTDVTFSACDWSLGFDTVLDGMVTFADNSTNRIYYNTAALTATTVYSASFLIKTGDGVQPTFGTTASDIGHIVLGNANITAGYAITDLGSGIFFVSVTGTTGVASLTNTGFVKSTVNNAIGFEVSAFMVVLGTVTLTIFDYLRTTGASATRAVTDARKTDFPELITMQALMDVDLNADSAEKRILRVGADDNNHVSVSIDSSNRIELKYVVASSTIWTITSYVGGSTQYRIGLSVDGVDNKLLVDNAVVGSNALAYVPQGVIATIGGNISGTSNKLVDEGVSLFAVASGLTESELIQAGAFADITDLLDFKRLESDSLADLTALITTLEATIV